jgi:hypothetical protein
MLEFFIRRFLVNQKLAQRVNLYDFYIFIGNNSYKRLLNYTIFLMRKAFAGQTTKQVGLSE